VVELNTEKDAFTRTHFLVAIVSE